MSRRNGRLSTELLNETKDGAVEDRVPRMCLGGEEIVVPEEI